MKIVASQSLHRWRTQTARTKNQISVNHDCIEDEDDCPLFTNPNIAIIIGITAAILAIYVVIFQSLRCCKLRMIDTKNKQL